MLLQGTQDGIMTPTLSSYCDRKLLGHDGTVRVKYAGYCSRRTWFKTPMRSTSAVKLHFSSENVATSVPKLTSSMYMNLQLHVVGRSFIYKLNSWFQDWALQKTIVLCAPGTYVDAEMPSRVAAAPPITSTSAPETYSVLPVSRCATQCHKLPWDPETRLMFSS